MGETTHISWCDHTFNGWIGCTEVSVGDQGACVGCYARALAERYGFAQWGDHPRHRTSAANWRKPMSWDRRAAREGSRPFVFCSSLADVFDNQVPAGWRRDLFDLIRATPHLTWLLLTKRPQNIVKMAKAIAEEALGPYADEEGLRSWWPRNAAIGCTVVTQAEADRDVPYLLTAKAALNPTLAFLSMEPLMEAVDLARLSTIRFPGAEVLNALTGELEGMFGDACATRLPAVDWVITGGETDQGQHEARLSHPTWFASLRDQCAAAGVPYHHKQHGEWAPICWMGEELSEAIYHPAPRRDPEAIRRCKVESAVMHRDGSLHGIHELNAFADGAMTMFKVGKRRSGRLVDGRLHDARPEVR